MEFTLEHEFKVPAEALYNGFLDSKTHSEMTGAQCVIQPIVNGEFSAWDGYITGKNLELKPNRFIRQTWRTTEFQADQKDSILELEFVDLDKNKSKLILKHLHLIETDWHYKQGWIDFYFTPMTEYFNGL